MTITMINKRLQNTETNTITTSNTKDKNASVILITKQKFNLLQTNKNILKRQRHNLQKVTKYKKSYMPCEDIY